MRFAKFATVNLLFPYRKIELFQKSLTVYRKNELFQNGLQKKLIISKRFAEKTIYFKNLNGLQKKRIISKRFDR